MTNQDEPAYMLAARSNTRDGVPSSGYIVEKLIQRIERLEQARLDDISYAAGWIREAAGPAYAEKFTQEAKRNVG